MSRSVNVKQSALTKRMGGKKKDRSKKGQSGTHRLKQLKSKETVVLPEPIKPKIKKESWFKRLFKK